MKLDSYKNKSQIKMKTNYVMYCRKSSESEDRQMASIPSQIAVLKELTAEKGIHAFKKFSESRSAKAPGRSEFDRMLQFIKERSDIKGIVCWKLNRLSRNPIDTGALQWLLQNKNIEEIVTPSKTYTEIDSDFIMAVKRAQTNHFIKYIQKHTKNKINDDFAKS